MTCSALQVGFVGHHNLGDEIMRHCLKHLAINCWSIEHFRSDSRYKLSYHPASSRLLNRSRRILDDSRLLWRSVRSDVLIHGGGSIFHSGNSSRWKRLLTSRARKLKTGRFVAMAIGVGLGPFASKYDFQACKDALDTMDLILVRDFSSLAIASEMNLSTPVQLCADPAYLLPEAYPQLAKAPRKPTNEVCWIMCPSSTSSVNTMAKTIGEAMSRSYAQTGVQHRMVVFNTNRAFHDTALAELVESTVGSHPFFKPTLAYNGSNDLALLSAIKNSDAVVASRLHGIVTATLLDTPVVPISYHRKCTDYVRESGVGGDCLELHELHENALVERILAALASAPGLSHADTMKEPIRVLRDAPMQLLADTFEGRAAS
ncbi:polysaccharide pyruvyl transferase family protein [Pseudodesulfovibrio sp.]|nr:polysaccharide pyruvyl transferase family protein [Pseudodesulfovibrio sp.]